MTSDRSACPVDGAPLTVDPTPIRDNRFGLPHEIHVGWCGACGLGVTLDPPSQDELDRLYEETYVAEDGLPQRVPRTGPLARVWHLVNGSLPLSDKVRAGPVLDVGCNTGETLVALRARGIDGVGLEPNPRAAAIARGHGLEVWQEPIETADLPRAHFAGVLLSQVLEHVHDPGGVLRKAALTLRPGGVAYIVVPNAASGWRRVFGRHWVHWHVPFHLFHHTERSLEKLCRACGLELRRTANVTPGEWLLMSIAAWRNARRGRFSIEPFSGRYGRRLLIAPPARVLDALHRGDAIYAEAVPRGDLRR